MAAPRLELLTRPGCSLCDQARPVLARLAGDVGINVVERDITGDRRLVRTYGDMLPVVLVDGTVCCYWAVAEDRVRAALARPG